MIYDWNEQKFLVKDSTFLLQEGGYFETIKIEAEQFQSVDLHVERLIRSLQINGHTDYPNFQEILTKAKELLKNPKVEEYNVLKFVYFPSGHLIYFQFRTVELKDENYQKGVSLQVFSQGRDYADKYFHKGTNRKESLEIRETAQEKGYFEVIYQSKEGILLEGTVSNLFMIKGGVLYTPPIELGILAGTMRKKIMHVFSDKVKEECIHKATLSIYEGCFITNALIGIMPVFCIDVDGADYMYNIESVKQIQRQLNEMEKNR